jgi:hypothetical protein
MNLLRIRLPCPESHWQAPTASLWLECFEQTGKAPRHNIVGALS